MKKLLLLLLTLLSFTINVKAQTGVPISTGYTVTNSIGQYASLFRYKEKKWGDTTTKFRWVLTNQFGNIVDSKQRRINGQFSSGATALANKPPGFIDLPANDDFASTKEIGYSSDFPEEDFARAKSEYADAAANGATYILVSVKWNSADSRSCVFRTYTEQTANSSTSWQYYDDLIDYAGSLTTTTGKKMKVAIRFIAAIDDGSHNDIEGTNTSGFVGLSNMAKDHTGNVSRVAEGIGQISLSNTTAVSQALDFVQKGLTRYSARLASAGSKLLWFSVGTAAQWECGYGYENQQWPAARYQTSYDYSSFNKAGFRTYIQNQSKYSTIALVNAAWGTNFANYAAIEPPVGGSNSVYSSPIGVEWWLYNAQKVKEFQSSCKNLGVTYASTSKFALEWGSTTDDLSPRRMSLNIADMPTYSDMMKAQFGRMANNDNLSISLDAIRSNYTKKIGTELNSWDFVTQGGATTPAEIKSQMIYMGQGAIESGANDLLFISSKRNQSYFDVTMQGMQALKSYLTTNGGARITATTTINYSIGNILSNYSNWLQSWVAAGGSNGKRINLVQNPDIVIPNTCANQLSLYDNHTFCVGSTNYYSNDYYYAGEGSALRNDYNANRFKLWAATHSITYQNGSVNSSNYTFSDLAKSNWSIKGATDNITYVSNTQTDGFFSAQNGSNVKENNHPARDYNQSLAFDSIFYIPIASQNFTVTMTNTSSVNLTFAIDALDPSVLLFRKKLVPGATATYTINMAAVQKSSIKNIKINCNRDSNTDTIADFSL